MPLSRKNAWQKCLSFWCAKMKKPMGSLYDLVEEEEEEEELTQAKAINILENGVTDDEGTINRPNFVYTSHVMVVNTVDICMSAAHDFIYLMKLSQDSVYACMSIWIGKTEDPLIGGNISFLKGQSLTEALTDMRHVLAHLELTNPEEAREILFTLVDSIYEDFWKLSCKLERLTIMINKHIKDLIPTMLKYTGKNYPPLSTFRKNSSLCTISPKMSALSYAAKYEQILTEKSLSVIHFTPLPVLSSNSIHTGLLGRACQTAWRILSRISTKKTEVIRAPVLSSGTIVSNVDDSELEFRTGVDDTACEVWSTCLNNEGIVVLLPPSFLSTSSSICIMDEVMKQQLLSQGVSVVINDDYHCVGSPTHDDPQQSVAMKSGFDSVENFKSAFSFMEPQQNMKDVVGLQEFVGVSESRTSKLLTECCNEQCPAFYSITFPEDPKSYNLNRIKEVKYILSTISRIIREMEARLNQLPYENLLMNPNLCMELKDIVRVINDESKLLDVINDYGIYREEEVKVANALATVFSDVLKTSDLFKSFATMVIADKDLFCDILKEFNAEELTELRSVFISQNKLRMEVKRCPPLDFELGCPKLITADKMNN